MSDHRAGNCQRCGTLRWRLDKDHIVPKLFGGTDDPSNIQWLCQNCHCDKTFLEDKIHQSEEYRTLMGRLGSERWARYTPERATQIRDHVKNMCSKTWANYTPEQRAIRQQKSRLAGKMSWVGISPEERARRTELNRKASQIGNAKRRAANAQ
jgi:hypothetical protein